MVAESQEEAVQTGDDYAPEHLEPHVDNGQYFLTD
jgi:histidinol dehydrogenase